MCVFVCLRVCVCVHVLMFVYLCVSHVSECLGSRDAACAALLGHAAAPDVVVRLLKFHGIVALRADAARLLEQEQADATAHAPAAETASSASAAASGAGGDAAAASGGGDARRREGADAAATAAGSVDKLMATIIAMLDAAELSADSAEADLRARVGIDVSAAAAGLFAAAAAAAAAVAAAAHVIARRVTRSHADNVECAAAVCVTEIDMHTPRVGDTSLAAAAAAVGASAPRSVIASSACACGGTGDTVSTKCMCVFVIVNATDIFVRARDKTTLHECMLSWRARRYLQCLAHQRKPCPRPRRP